MRRQGVAQCEEPAVEGVQKMESRTTPARLSGGSVQGGERRIREVRSANNGAWERASRNQHRRRGMAHNVERD